MTLLSAWRLFLPVAHAEKAAGTDEGGDRMSVERTILTDAMGARVAPMLPGKVKNPGRITADTPFPRPITMFLIGS
ncbi:MAG: hypothetical protein OXD33_03355 [Rhodobacteraceae bacterium]|nr:hypothetical protein [Paracoccaceae bacterium]